MSIKAKVLADSVGPLGDRLTTLELTYPRFIHSELMTHREFSRNSASSRAIPVAKMLAKITEEPVVPVWWGKNQGGMQAYEEISDKNAAEDWWRAAAQAAVEAANVGISMNLHKQIVNRIVEPWMWITVIVSSTSWTNFIGLRDHHAAEPHIQQLARCVREVLYVSIPKKLKAGEWHLPLIDDEERQSTDVATLVKVSVGRCARVSYLTHDGKRDMAEDIALHDKLIVQEPLHASPAEHVAMALNWPRWFKRDLPISSRELNAERMKNRENPGYLDLLSEIQYEAALAQIQSGNFRGWKQLRKMHANEYIGEPKA